MTPEALVVLGDTGMLGREIVEYAETQGLVVLGSSSRNVSLGEFNVDVFLDTCAYDIIGVVCAAAIHKPDIYDTNYYFDTNTFQPARLRHEFWARRIPFHFISTDYVFAHRAGYVPTYFPARPFSPYGVSKAMAEHLLLERGTAGAYIYRCAHMFGKHPCRGKTTPNVIDTMAAGAAACKPMMWSSGPASITYAREAAEYIVRCAVAAGQGATISNIHHVVQLGNYSLFDVAQHVYGRLGANYLLVEEGPPNPAAGLLVDNYSDVLSRWDYAVDAHLKETWNIA